MPAISRRTWLKGVALVSAAGDASNAGVHTIGSQSYQGGCSLPGPSQRDADVPHVQVLHVGRQERWHVHGHDGNRSLPTSRRWDQPNGMVRLVCSCVTRERAGLSC